MPMNPSTPEMTPKSPASSQDQPKTTTVAIAEKSPAIATSSPVTAPGRVETKRAVDKSGETRKPDSKRTDEVKVEAQPS